MREEAGDVEIGIGMIGESEGGEEGSREIEGRGFELSEGAVRDRLLSLRSGAAGGLIMSNVASGGKILFRAVSSSWSASSFSFFSLSLDSALFVKISLNFAAEISSCCVGVEEAGGGFAGVEGAASESLRGSGKVLVVFTL